LSFDSGLQKKKKKKKKERRKKRKIAKRGRLAGGNYTTKPLMPNVNTNASAENRTRVYRELHSLDEIFVSEKTFWSVCRLSFFCLAE